MEVMIDATGLADDSAYRGIGTYLRHLLAALAVDPDVSVTALVPARGRVSAGADHRDGPDIPAGVEQARLHRIAPGRWRRIEHELLLPLDLARRSADLFHSPALDPPARCPEPWVQTLHDVIPLVFDDPELAAERRRWHRHAVRCRRASAIIAVSRHTADVAVSTLGLDHRRIEVIHHGVSARFTPGDRSGTDEAPYLLMVGEYSRRKGYREAFAVAGAMAELGYPHRLRVVGRIASWVRPAVDALVAAAPAPERIDLLGFVEDVVAEYQRAEVLVMTSRYEGFGFPVLEAMACGTPVVAFANSSITEVVGDAGILVDDGDVPRMVAAVRSVCDDRQLWHELSQRGIERAAEFSWERSARAHAEIYRRCARTPVASAP
jgi:glycosyltransferase involved in cell wall biosynthesis